MVGPVWRHLLTEDQLWIPYGLHPPTNLVHECGSRAKFDRCDCLTLVPGCASRYAQLGVSLEG